MPGLLYWWPPASFWPLYPASCTAEQVFYLLTIRTQTQANSGQRAASASFCRPTVTLGKKRPPWTLHLRCWCTGTMNGLSGLPRGTWNIHESAINRTGRTCAGVIPAEAAIGASLWASATSVRQTSSFRHTLFYSTCRNSGIDRRWQTLLNASQKTICWFLQRDYD